MIYCVGIRVDLIETVRLSLKFALLAKLALAAAQLTGLKPTKRRPKQLPTSGGHQRQASSSG